MNCCVLGGEGADSGSRLNLWLWLKMEHRGESRGLSPSVMWNSSRLVPQLRVSSELWSESFWGSLCTIADSKNERNKRFFIYQVFKYSLKKGNPPTYSSRSDTFIYKVLVASQCMLTLSLITQVELGLKDLPDSKLLILGIPKKELSPKRTSLIFPHKTNSTLSYVCLSCQSTDTERGNNSLLENLKMTMSSDSAQLPWTRRY